MINHLINLIKQDKSKYKFYTSNLILSWCDKIQRLALYNNGFVDMEEMSDNRYILYWEFVAILKKLKIYVEHYSDTLVVEFESANQGKMNIRILNHLIQTS